MAWLTHVERSPNTGGLRVGLKLFVTFLADPGLVGSGEPGDVGRVHGWLRSPAENVIVLAQRDGGAGGER